MIGERREDIKRLAIENLESHGLKVNGMRVVSRVDKLPDLHTPEDGLFGNRVVPAFAVHE